MWFGISHSLLKDCDWLLTSTEMLFLPISMTFVGQVLRLPTGSCLLVPANFLEPFWTGSEIGGIDAFEPRERMFLVETSVLLERVTQTEETLILAIFP